MMNKNEYDLIHSLVFDGTYPGYRPSVLESPNRDGKIDSEKRYAHVALKYIDEDKDLSRKKTLLYFLEVCHNYACDVAKEIKASIYKTSVNTKWEPDIRYSAMRILDYPAGAYSNEHTDFDLFTLMLYRDQPDKFIYVDGNPDVKIQTMSPQIHYGELLEDVSPLKATKHRVDPSDTPQHSIVYFAIPDRELHINKELTVGDWLDNKMKLARIYA